MSLLSRVLLVALACHSVGRSQSSSAVGKLDPNVLNEEQRSKARSGIGRDIASRTVKFNRLHRETWYKVKSREQWEKYRDARIERLRRSLGASPKAGKPNVRVTRIHEGDGYKLENSVFESRPGLWVVGNLYTPAKPRDSMPGILIAHAHHRGKNHSEHQAMGMTWARAGCMVLVIDQVGYGERRSHPFDRDEDYAKPYRVSRQDYYHRYDTGIQLQLLGDSLMGWMAWDLMRGVDVLLARDGIDPKRILLLGAVAGGGDPAGVTAALDPRITCCVPFNFGGPQPETKYPLPEDAETSFNYLLFTYWDSTRGLRLGGSGDFPHWVITASIAPRYLIHGHEFSWDGKRDPVWKRYQKVWGDFYGQADRVGVAHGKGLLKLRPPAASHCTHIGEYHRRMIHPLFAKWFGIEATEYHAPRPSSDLRCWTDESRKELVPKSLLEVMTEEGTERIRKARKRLSSASPKDRRRILKTDWEKLLGPIASTEPSVVKAKSADTDSIDGVKVERVILETEPGVVVPLLVLVPEKGSRKKPLVVGLSSSGKAGFVKERAEDLRNLLQAGVAVALPDVRGTGETRSGSTAGKNSSDTHHSVHLQVFGETLLGQRIRDLRSVLDYLRKRPDVDAERIALWGDSFAPTNSSNTNFVVPHGVDGRPRHSEPTGGLLALFGALYEDDVRAVFVSGGLLGYHGVLGDFAVLVPHGDCIPGALSVGDLCDVAGALAPRPLHFESMVDHRNRAVSEAKLREAYAPTIRQYRGSPKVLSFSKERTSPSRWLLEHLR